MPAGGARFDLGHEIIMNAQDVLRLMGVARGAVVANHREALSHCPVTRAELLGAARAAGVAHRLWVPENGAAVSFTHIEAPLLAEAE